MIFKNRPTIGLLSEILPEGYLTALFKGVITACREHNVNLRIFIGGPLNSPVRHQRNYNMIYNYAGAENVDGLILLSGTLGIFTTRAEQNRFIKRYGTLAKVGIGQIFEGMPNIVIDNKEAVYSITSHLIRQHHYRKIAYLGGPAGLYEASNRLEGYKKALTEADIPIRPEFIIDGDFLTETGVRAGKEIFEEKKLDIEAVVCANDAMALGFFNYCKRKRIRIPDDIGVTGFDNILDSHYTSPLLTTVAQPLLGFGKQAVGTILDILDNKSVPSLVTLPTTLILRESCGCKCIRDSISPDPESFTGKIESRVFVELQRIKHRLIKEISQAHILEYPGELVSWIIRLVDVVIGNENEKYFLTRLSAFIKEKALSEEDLNNWLDFLNKLYSEVRTNPLLKRVRYKIKYLVFHTLYMVKEEIWKEMGVLMEHHHNTRSFRDSSIDNISPCINLPDLLKTIKEELRNFDLDCLYLSLFKGPELGYPIGDIAGKPMQLMIGYDGKKLIEGDFKENQLLFDPSGLVPGDFLDSETRHTLVIEPLIMNNFCFGYIVRSFSLENSDFSAPIHQQICTNLNLIRLFTESENRQKALNELNISLEQKVNERTEELVKQQSFIMRSIDYARSIQNSILPGEGELKRTLGSYFLLWLPRDTVGGDIYWFKETNEGFLLALVDCTGHGIPAAFMSMTCNSVLNHITETICDNDPAFILKEMNRIVKKTLHQDKDETPDLVPHTDEGMDICLCYYRRQQGRLLFSGAKRPLYYIKNGSLQVIAGDGQSIGYRGSSIDYNYVNHTIEVEKEDTFYLTSDGFTDQIGGKKGFTFGKKQFSRLLTDIGSKKASEQKRILEQTLKEYQGSQAQIDDITIVGFKGDLR